MPGKLGRTSKERNALLRNLASQLLWYGKIETTAAKAKELKSYVEKLITKAVNTYDDNIEFEVTKKDAKGKEVTVTSVKDGAKKLAARRAIMAKTYDFFFMKIFFFTSNRRRIIKSNNYTIRKQISWNISSWSSTCKSSLHLC